MISASDAPNITDWLQGVGTVLALAVTGGGLLWEVRSRRLENVAQEISRARCVIVTAEEPEFLEEDLPISEFDHAAVTVTNHSSEPITNVRVYPSGGDAHGELWPSFAPVIGPGKEFYTQWKLLEPFSLGGESMPRLINKEAEKLTIDFQIAGRRWIRVGNADPKLWREMGAIRLTLRKMRSATKALTG
ncbi:hypothetical protein ACFQS1_39175 [Paractinoplanes rhizophilus]|uniref:Uncharacterized protein n=1 Tax=Paractinoplanes rhizophilus TaxID=1416877 RepID=A0ABW2I542_9ACTN